MDREYAKYILNKTHQDYNLIARDFAVTREKPWPELRFLFDDYLISGERILDLGCGNGRFFEFCQGKGLDYFGVDSSEKLIEIARKNHPNVHFQVADAFSLPFSNDFFDKIYSIAVLHHIPSQELRLQFLKEAKRVLKPKGILILTVWDLWQNTSSVKSIIKSALLKVFGRSKLDFQDIFVPWGKICQRYVHCFTKKELKELAEKAGFGVKKASILKMSKGKKKNIYIVVKNLDKMNYLMYNYVKEGG